MNAGTTDDRAVIRAGRGAIAAAVIAATLSACAGSPPPPPPPPAPFVAPGVVTMGSFPTIDAARAAVIAAGYPADTFVVATVAGKQVKFTASGDLIESGGASSSGLRPPRPPQR